MDIKALVKVAIKSRAYMALWLLVFVQTLILAITVLMLSHANELQAPVRYSAFSDIQFYRDQWHYLLMLAVFAVVVFVTNSLVGLKIFSERGREMAIGFMILSSLVFVISTVLIVALLRVANLI